jgi:hypothetical protein
MSQTSTEEEKRNQKRKWVTGLKQKKHRQNKKTKKKEIKKALRGKIYNIKNYDKIHIFFEPNFYFKIP